MGEVREYNPDLLAIEDRIDDVERLLSLLLRGSRVRRIAEDATGELMYFDADGMPVVNFDDGIPRDLGVHQLELVR